MKFGHEYKGTTDRDFGDIFGEDWFIVILLCIVATVGWIIYESGTVICVENACYLHVHSFVCYLLWSIYNTLVGFSIYLMIEFFVGKAIIHNLIVFFMDLYASRKERKALKIQEAAKRKNELDLAKDIDNIIHHRR